MYIFEKMCPSVYRSLMTKVLAIKHKTHLIYKYLITDVSNWLGKLQEPKELCFYCQLHPHSSSRKLNFCRRNDITKHS
jgi:hypothetical protein